MPRARIRKAPEVAVRTPESASVVVRLVPPYCVQWREVFLPSGKRAHVARTRTRYFASPWHAFVFAETEATRQRVPQPWIEGLPARPEATHTPGPRRKLRRA